MSIEEQVESLLSGSGAGESLAAKAATSLRSAEQEIRRMLSISNTSIHDLCINIEKAKSKSKVKAAFKQLNMVVRILLEAAPGEAHD